MVAWLSRNIEQFHLGYKLIKLLHVLVAGSPGRVKSTFKYGDPLKIFVLMYKKILRKEIFHFEASYYPSQHTPHLPSSLS